MTRRSRLAGPPARRASDGAASLGVEARARERMVERLRTQGIVDEDVLGAMRSVPRHAFVDEALRARAYDDAALPIGLGQTISQPFVVAHMISLVLEPARRTTAPVLEVGFGCGYQSALLAALGLNVFAVERIASFVRETRERLHRLGTRGVRLKHADGAHGWDEHAPFGAVLVAAAAPRVPPALAGQLADGGRLVMPIGLEGEQRLACVTRAGEQFAQRRLDAVSFVPLLPGAV